MHCPSSPQRSAHSFLQVALTDGGPPGAWMHPRTARAAFVLVAAVVPRVPVVNSTNVPAVVPLPRRGGLLPARRHLWPRKGRSPGRRRCARTPMATMRGRRRALAVRGRRKPARKPQELLARWRLDLAGARAERMRNTVTHSIRSQTPARLSAAHDRRLPDEARLDRDRSPGVTHSACSRCSSTPRSAS